MITYIILGIIVLILVWLIADFNSLVTLRNRAKEAWADIDVQLKRRYDLIPNLVNTVKGYASHEKTVFDDVTKARSAALNAGNLWDKAKAEDQISTALKSIFAIAEAYPELKANQNFLALQSELSDTENKIQAARRFYNVNVRELNTHIETFPGNIVANTFGFQKMEYFELTSGNEKEPVTVSFN